MKNISSAELDIISKLHLKGRGNVSVIQVIPKYTIVNLVNEYSRLSDNSIFQKEGRHDNW